MNNTNGRKKSLIAALIICVFAGFGYSWSVIQLPIVNEYGFQEIKVALCFTLTIFFSTITPLIFAPLIKKLGIKKVCILGGILLGLGLFLSAYMSTVLGLYFSYGLLSGLGVGFIYPNLMAYSIKLFPHRQGLSSGIMAASYGSGAVIWAPLVGSLFESLTIKEIFIRFGIIFIFVIIIASLFLEEKFMNINISKNRKIQNHTENNLTRNQMVKTKEFYLMLIMFTFCLTSGLMIIGQSSPILINMLDFTLAKAAFYAGLFSVSNTLGRLIFGGISDKLGKVNTLQLLIIISAISMLLISKNNYEKIILIAMFLSAMCYGGYATLITPLTSIMFGEKYITENYGVMYLVFGLAGFLGPRAAVFFKNIDAGSYNRAFRFAFVLNIIAILISVFIKRKVKIKNC